jgi:hypothetical protein
MQKNRLLLAVCSCLMVGGSVDAHVHGAQGKTEKTRKVNRFAGCLAFLMGRGAGQQSRSTTEQSLSQATTASEQGSSQSFKEVTSDGTETDWPEQEAGLFQKEDSPSASTQKNPTAVPSESNVRFHQGAQPSTVTIHAGRE